MEVVVIGGGASGILASIYASKNKNINVTILEKNNCVLKKILVTGNGRCNYFNSDFTINHFVTSDYDWLSNVITSYNKNEILNFFDSLGVVPFIKDGYYYPYSNQASTIRNILVKELNKNNINIVTGTTVSSVTFKDNKYIIKTNNGKFIADALVISNGTSASQNNNNIIINMGHEFNHYLPGLTSLNVQSKYLKKWKGVRSKVIVSLEEDGEIIDSEIGEMLFTDYGVSGICIFNLSLRVSNGLYNNKKENIIINFAPFTSDFDKYYLDNINLDVHSFLCGFLNSKLVDIIMDKSNISNKKLNMLSNREYNSLKENIISFKLEVVSTKGIKDSQVLVGGILTKNINPYTMESKIYNNLYFTGEVLDVTGKCGGYNLGFSFITGYLAGHNIANR